MFLVSFFPDWVSVAGFTLGGHGGCELVMVWLPMAWDLRECVLMDCDLNGGTLEICQPYPMSWRTHRPAAFRSGEQKIFDIAIAGTMTEGLARP